MAEPVGQAELIVAQEAWSGDSDEEVREFFTELIATIDVNLLGPDDDGEEAAQYFYLRAIERAHDFAREQPCECTFDAVNGDPEEVCERCRVIGCSLTDHRRDAGCRRFVSADEQNALLARVSEVYGKSFDRDPSDPLRITGSEVIWKFTRDQLNVLAWPYKGREFFSRIQPQLYGRPVEIVATEAESSLA